MGMRFAVVIPWVLSILVAATVASAQEDAVPLGGLGEPFEAIKGFGKIRLELYGDAEKSGLSKSELNAFIKEEILRSFKGMKMLPLPEIPLNYTDDRAIRTYSEELYKLGYVYVEVFVVGEEYPIAYHIGCRFGNCLYMDESRKWAFWEREALGFTSREDLKDDILTWLAKLSEIIAKDFYDSKGH